MLLPLADPTLAKVDRGEAGKPHRQHVGEITAGWRRVCVAQHKATTSSLDELRQGLPTAIGAD